MTLIYTHMTYSIRIMTQYRIQTYLISSPFFLRPRFFTFLSGVGATEDVCCVVASGLL